MLDSKLWEDVDNEYFEFNGEKTYFYDHRGRPTTSIFTVVDEEPENTKWNGLYWKVEMSNIDVLKRHLEGFSQEISYMDFLEHYAYKYTLNDRWDLCDE